MDVKSPFDSGDEWFALVGIILFASIALLIIAAIAGVIR